MRDYIRRVYKKIVEQSKKKFFFEVFFVPKKTETKIEIFQLNLIIVLWYMKKKNFKQEEITFLSSGTTGMIQSKHHVKYLNDYIDSFKASWLHFFKDFSRYQFIPLLPAYADREGSSLILMVQELMKLSGQTDHTFYLNEYDKVESAYHLALNNEKTPIIFGVTFALLDLVSRKFSFPEAIIIPLRRSSTET